MTPRERILAVLDKREPDRMPIDFAGTDCSSVHAIAYNNLRKELGIEPRPVRVGCLTQQVVEADIEVVERMGGDAAILLFHPRSRVEWDSGYGFPVEIPERWKPEEEAGGSVVIRNADGEAVSRRPKGGYYFDPVRFPLADVESPDELSKYDALFDRWDWPAVLDESPEAYAARAKELHAGTDRAVIACWRMHYLQAGTFMRGYEQFMIDLLTEETLVRAIYDKLHAVYMARAERFLDLVADSIDVVFFTDDLGTQSGPLVRPEMYRRLIKPYWKELIGLIKSRDKKVLMHSCGAVSDFIPDLIEMGVDAVNPVQITAKGMSPERLKRDFGMDIAFWGGGVSTQGVLDGGTPDDVREEVKRNVEIFASGGGFVFTQVHNIQAEVPVENIIAAYETAMELAGG